MRDSEKYQKEINIIRSYIKELKTVDKLTLLNGKDYETNFMGSVLFFSRQGSN